MKRLNGREWQRRGESRRWGAAAGSLVLVLACGCAAVRNTPFQEFHASVVALHGSADRAVGGAVAAEREAVLEKLKAGELHLAQVALILPSAGYRWELFVPDGKDADEVPPYYVWKQTRLELQRASLAVLGYAEVLVLLARPERMSEKECDRLQASLDGLARSGLRRLDGTATRKRATEAETAGILSSVAADGFRACLRHRRAADLKAAILANHENFVRYAGTLGELVEQLRAHLQRHYQRTSQGLLSGPGGIEEKGKKLLDLNDAAIARLEMLAALHDVIAVLPAAHADLAAANPGAGAALQTLAGCAERLARLVDTHTAGKPGRN